MNINTVKEQRLTLAEEREFIARAQAGESEAFEPLLACYINNIRKAARVATKTTGVATPVTYEDAVSAGYLALVEAVLAVDLANPEYRVAGIISHALANAMSAVVGDALPVSVPERTLKRYYGIMRRAEGNVNVAVVLAPDFGMSIEVFLGIHGMVTSVDSLDAEVGHDRDGGEGATTLYDSVAVAMPDVETEALNRVLVQHAFTAVNETEKQIVRLSYGFEEYGDPVPDIEIGHRIGMTRPTVQRNRNKALDKMRDRLAVDQEA